MEAYSIMWEPDPRMYARSTAMHLKYDSKTMSCSAKGVSALCSTLMPVGQ